MGEEAGAPAMAEATELLLAAKRDGFLQTLLEAQANEIAATEASDAARRESDALGELERTRAEARVVQESLADLKLNLAYREAESLDVHFALNKRLDDNYDIITELERQLLKMQTEWEAKEKDLQNEVRIEAEELEKTSGAAQKELDAARATLEHLQPHLDQQDALRAQRASLEERLVRLQSEDRAQLEKRDRELLKARAALRAAQKAEAEATTARVRAAADATRADTIDATVRDNNELREALAQRRGATEAEYYRYGKLDATRKRLQQELRLQATYRQEADAARAKHEGELHRLQKDWDAASMDEQSEVASLSMCTSLTSPRSDAESGVAKTVLRATEHPEVMEARSRLAAALADEKELEDALRASETSGDRLARAALAQLYRLERGYAQRVLRDKLRATEVPEYGRAKVMPSFAKLRAQATAEVLRRLLQTLADHGFAECDLQRRMRDTRQLPPICQTQTDRFPEAADAQSSLFASLTEERSYSRVSHAASRSITVDAALQTHVARKLRPLQSPRPDHSMYGDALPTTVVLRPAMRRSEDFAQVKQQYRRQVDRHHRKSTSGPQKPRGSVALASLAPRVTEVG